MFQLRVTKEAAIETGNRIMFSTWKQITLRLTHSESSVNTHFNFQVQGARIVTKTIPGHAGKLTAVLKFKTLFLGHPLINMQNIL